MNAPGQPARAAAAALVAGVLEDGRMLSEQSAALAGLSGPERARAQSLAIGVMRHLGRIDTLLATHMRKRPASAALNALRLAVAEMFVDAIPPHAAVDGAVRLAQSHPKGKHLTGLVNAVARKVSEAPEAWAQTPEAPLPAWLEGPLRAKWGDVVTDAIAAAHLMPTPLDLTLRDPATAEVWTEKLGAERLPTGSLRLAMPGQVTTMPGFTEGAWWVQDAAAAIPARLVGEVAGLRVLDLCAAPGGKTLQLAAEGAHVTALDISGPRLKRLAENLERTGLKAHVVSADALTWEPANPFDAILLDAPCSASGTIRRHPDLPHLRMDRDLAPLVKLQAQLLARAWDWLAPGGRLVYGTCSLLPVEGEDILSAFCAATPEAMRRGVDATALGVDPEWIDAEGALRTRPDFWPEKGGLDGFYAALLVKGAD